MNAKNVAVAAVLVGLLIIIVANWNGAGDEPGDFIRDAADETGDMIREGADEVKDAVN